MENYKKLTKCRICSSEKFKNVLSLGMQNLTGVFPKTVDTEVTSGPLDLVWCRKCGLLQLGHSYDLTEMYGDNYGYRSGLNKSMVRHLSDKILILESLVSLKAGDDNSGSLAIFNKFGENIVVLSKLKASDSGQVFVTDKHGEIISALVPTGVATAEEAKR